MTNRWWLPLLIPAVLLALLAFTSVHRGRHVVHQTVVMAVAGTVAFVVLVVWPSFAAGVGYQRSRSN
jgi:hypothetical protein